jgi:hypothetical protein
VADAGQPPPPPVAPADEIEKLLTGTHERIKADRGPLAWLRCRPTSQRLAAVLLVVAGLLGLTLWRFQRPDFAEYPHGRMAVTFSVYLVILGLSIRELVRPLYAARVRLELFIFATAAAPFLMATLPATDRPPDLFAIGHGHDCIPVGVLAGFALMQVVRALERAPRVGTGPSLFLGNTAGILANLILVLHCPIDRPAHLLTSHAFLGVALGALARAFERRSRRAAA